jgi:hypothetical protein
MPKPMRDLVLPTAASERCVAASTAAAEETCRKRRRFMVRLGGGA